MSGRRLTLLVPGLFGPEADRDAGSNQADRAREAGVLTSGLELPHLVRVLSRARMVAADGLGETLEALYFKAFELPAPPDADLPVAALTAAIDGLDSAEGFWLRADPVYLRPDLARLILRDSRDFDIQMDEARHLAAELNAELQDDDLKLLPAHPARWYLRLATQPAFTSVSPASAHGCDADSCLLRGEAARHWHQLQNRIQMLLHHSPINTDREAWGQPPINSLWFWGLGAMPELPARAWGQVSGDDPLLEGLAAYSGSPCVPLVAGFDEWIETAPAADCLVVIQAALGAVRAQDRNAWQDALEMIENQWLAPVIKSFAEGQLEILTVATGGAWSFIHSARDARAWWRRDKPLKTLFSRAREISR